MKFTRHLFILLLLSGLLRPTGAWAGDGKVYLVGQVRNLLNHQLLSGALVTLMTTDSTVIDTCRTNENTSSLNMKCIYNFEVDANMPAYILKAELDGYEPAYLNLPAKQVKGMLLAVDPILLKRQHQVQLGEVTVQATKIKFYNKGDTLVYNADAFQLAQGSMLDVLIRQMPGVQLKDNGEITVNGQHVESLLINGEDFFKGNRQIMLDNLPAYMVKNVKVFRKAETRNKVLAKTGRKLAEDPLVMDVRLKKDYEVGWIGNLEAGYGTHQRWLGRAFASMFSPTFKISAFGNVNNLNDARRPGDETSWTPEAMPDGRLTQRMAGVNYSLKQRDDKWKLSGDLTLSHSDDKKLTRTSQENYLTSGSSYTRSEDDTRNHTLTLSTQHKVTYQPTLSLTAGASASLDWTKWRNTASLTSATFNQDPTKSVPDARALLDSINQPQAGTLLRQLAANRFIESLRVTGHRVKSKEKVYFEDYLNEGMTTSIYAGFTFSYDGQSQRDFNHYRLDYPTTPSLPADYRNRYSLSRPNRTTSYQLELELDHWLNDVQYFTLGYQLYATQLRHDYALYRLDQLTGYSADDAESPLGTLPSAADYGFTQDLQNSFYRDQTEWSHEWSLSYNISRWHGDDKDISLTALLPVKLTNANMDYRQASFDGHKHRRTVFVSPYFNVRKMWRNQQYWAQFTYRLSNESPDLVRFIDVMTNEDPLNVTLGNPNLKNAHTHYFQLNYHMGADDWYYQMWLETWLYDNQVAMGRTYNSTTGVMTNRPENVDGNRIFQAGFAMQQPLDHAHHLTLSNRLTGSVTRNVDLSATVTADGKTLAPLRSIVTTDYLHDELGLSYKWSKVTLGLSGNLTYIRTHSRREDFDDQHVWKFNYGPTFKADLPHGWQLSTDLKVYSRRGFADPSVNTDDVVWNARLSKSIPRANLTIMVDAFDMLQQLSNVTASLNYQGRTEVWRNVLPSYILFHAIYRFSKQPRKH